MSSINPAPQPSQQETVRQVYAPPAAPGGFNVKTALVSGFLLALAAANVYLFMQLNDTKADLAKTKDALVGEIDKVREASSLSSQSHRRNVENLKTELETTRRQANMAAGQAKIDAIRRTEELTGQLAKEQQAQQIQQQAMKADLTKVEATATTATAKIGEVSTEVGSVKTDVATTKSDLEKTVANLKRAVGDISSQGSLIATNSTELSALRALGERNYIEFRLTKSNTLQKVGDVSVSLKKADMKRNRYTIELMVDDKVVEKKDKTINEPVQFLTSKARQPYEIVVNEVKKDMISGYLATPKVMSSRN